MKIKESLLVSIIILSLTIFYESFKYMHNDYKDIKEVSKTRTSNESSYIIFKISTLLATERGLTGIILSSKDIDNTQVKKVLNLRVESEELINKILKRFEINNSLNKDLIYKFTQDYAALNKLRAELNGRFTVTYPTTNYSYLDDSFNTYTKVIDSLGSINLSILDNMSSNSLMYLKNLTNLKYYSWLLLEYSNRERGQLAGLINSRSPINTEKLKKLTYFTVSQEDAWKEIIRINDNIGLKFAPQISKIQNVFFKDYLAFKENFYNAGLHGESYPHSSEVWFQTATNAIGDIVDFNEIISLEVIKNLDEISDDKWRELYINCIFTVLNLIFVIFSFWVVIQRVINPLKRMTEVMNKLAAGDTSVSIPAIGQKDEIGLIASSVQIFKDNALEKQKLEQQNLNNEIRAKQQKKELLNSLATSFEKEISSAIDLVSTSAKKLGETSSKMLSLTDNSSASTSAASGAANQIAANFQSLAAAIEEMSSTVKEISRQLEKSNHRVSAAVERIDSASKFAIVLQDASENVKGVMTFIGEISTKINLLALNATIESARAGEAGKGFAVVATEVKELAKETSTSVNKIQKTVEDMLKATSDITNNISEVRGSIEEIKTAADTISESVSQQSKANDEIASNMHLAVTEIKSISSNLVTVSEISNSSNNESKQVSKSSEDLSNQARGLTSQVNVFIEKLKNSE